MDKIRLLLRSVYLKGHQDGHLKTSDMSWEDKIVKDIDALYKQVFLEMLPAEKSGMIINPNYRDGFNACLAEVRAKLRKE